ncbi:hypothetical protein ACFXKW_38515 [Streptomyces sp. NPDC059193]|uniref:hypothetical protein n=1 Tax=Streptomyces sp. NPDC059193 TaxID=3346763 RepID=UPI00368A6854
MVLGSSLHVADNMLVITIHEPVTTAAATAATVSVVLRVHRHCTDNGLPMTVATPPAAARYLIKANQPTLPVHTDTHDALQAARTLRRR